MDNIFKKLEDSFLFDQKHNVILGIIEGVCAVLSGAFIHSLIAHYNILDLLFSITFTILFVYLLYRSLTKQKNFSISGLGELKASMELHDAKKDIERKDLIDGYIDDAIKALNSNTCNYDEIHVEANLCDQSLQIGLTSVCQPYFENPQNLLNSTRAKFTIGAYVNYFLRLPAGLGSEPVIALGDHDIFLPRDNFGFNEFLPKDILTDTNLTGLSFILQSQFSDTFRHANFVHGIFNYEGKNYSLITAPIPNVCESGSIGVLFIISEELNDIPSDLENVSRIFCRLFSNWLSRYDECVSARCEKNNTRFQQGKQPVDEPKEVTELKLSQATNGTSDG